MTRLDALKALAEKVEAGEWDFSHTAPARIVFPYQSASADDLGLTARAAFDGSLDAAQALHEAVLPGHEWAISNNGDYAGLGVGPAAAVASAESLRAGIDPVSESADTPARAWLLAILRALIAQEAAE